MMDHEKLIPVSLHFGFKSSPEEVEIDGQIGLLCCGVGSKSMEADSDREFQVPGSLLDSIDTWANKEKPPILYQHGFDIDLGPREIGYAVKTDITNDGLYAESFIPRDIWKTWKGPGAAAATRKFKQVYAGIKSGRINGYSVGGTFFKAGRALLKWWTTELSITPTPKLDSARFEVGATHLLVGAKALTDLYGPGVSDQFNDLPDQTARGYVLRDDWSQIMTTAQDAGDRGLHDALLAAPDAFQGVHDAEDCPLCISTRAIHGVKGADASDAQSPSSAEAQENTVAQSDDESHAALLQEVEKVLVGYKAGSKHSAATRARVKEVIDSLNEYFDLGEGDTDDADETQATASG